MVSACLLNLDAPREHCEPRGFRGTRCVSRNAMGVVERRQTQPEIRASDDGIRSDVRQSG